MRDEPGQRTLCGYPYVVSPNFPAPAASAKSAIFGHWPAGYLIRQVLDDVTILRLTETFAGTGQAGYIGFSRQDGQPGDAGALRAYQHSAT